MEYVIVYGLTILSLIITMGAQAYINSSYSKYSKVNNKKGITGSEAAREILDKNGFEDIKVVETQGTLTDHYDPKNKVIRLSTNIYRDSSIASVSVAAHECGHAIQDKKGYIFLRIRHSLIPVVNLCSYAGYLVIVLGAIFSLLGLIWIGIAAEMVILVFQLVTLPVEFDASKRGLSEIKKNEFLDSKEVKDGRTMLTAAALTYVASVAAAVIQILRLALIYGRRDR